MKISSLTTRTERQLRFLPTPLNTQGQARYEVGTYIEELTCRLFGGQKHRTDSRSDYCPDISIRAGDPEGHSGNHGQCPGPSGSGLRLYLECKAVGRSNQIIIYQGRVEKDRLFASTHDLWYVVWHHQSPTNFESVEELRSSIRKTLQAVYLIPFNDIHTICSQSPVIKLNSKYYGSPDNPLYGSGYRFSISLLRRFRILSFEREVWSD